MCIDCDPTTETYRCSSGASERCEGAGTWTIEQECTGESCDTDSGECISVPEIVAFTTATPSVNPGDSATLTWTVMNADDIELTPVDDSGDTVTVSPEQTTTYTLTATNEAGSASKTLTVHVVSAGQVVNLLHYGSSEDEIAVDMIVDEANNRVVTLNERSNYDHFFATHSLDDAQLLDQSPDWTDHFYDTGLVSAGGDVVVCGGLDDEGAVVTRFDSALQEVSEHAFVVNDPFYEQANALRIRFSLAAIHCSIAIQERT